MQYWRFGLLLLLMFPAVFAIEPLDLTLAVPVVAVIVTILLALSSMLATAISDPRLEAWTKTEIREFVAGILLVGLITAFFIGTTGISVAVTGQESYITASQNIVQGWIDSYANAYTYIISGASRIRAAATYAPYINIPLWYVSLSYSTNPLSGVGILLSTFNLAAQGLTNAMFIAEGLRLLIAFLKVTVPTILLPLAFSLRLIPFTRKTGNTLIALALAGIIFLPFSVILANDMNGLIDPNEYPNPTMDLSNLDADPWGMVAFEWACETAPIRLLLSLTDVLFALIVCIPLLLGVYTAPLYPVCYNLVKEVIYPIINVVFQLAGIVLLLAWEVSYGGPATDVYVDDIWAEIQPFFKDVNNLVLIGYIDFILIGIVTIAGARSLSAALGGEWYMAGIQRLI